MLDLVPGNYLCQIFLQDKETLAISVEQLKFSDSFGWMRPLPFEMGNPTIEVDKEAPSRAYSKLQEVISILFCHI